MFFTAQQIAESRELSLNNLLGASTACLEAGQRLNELLANSGRDALHSGGQHHSRFGHGQGDVLLQLPATLWLEHSARLGCLLGGACEILGETHKALIQNGEAQIRALDDIAFASLDRLAWNSPQEAAAALKTVRHTLESVEQGVHSASAAALGSLELAGQEIQQIIEAHPENTEQKPKASVRSRRTANKPALA